MTDKSTSAGNGDRLADDLLLGAGAIADFLYGSPEYRRKVYHLTATSRLPTFKLGSVRCARPSVLRKWIAAQEEESLQGDKESPEDGHED